jgi:hypothetical protein
MTFMQLLLLVLALSLVALLLMVRALKKPPVDALDDLDEVMFFPLGDTARRRKPDAAQDAPRRPE